MLSPESANFIPVRQQDADDAVGGCKEPSEVTEFEVTSNNTLVTNNTLDPEVSSGIYSIDSRLRQSAFSRYKVLGLYLSTHMYSLFSSLV